jgi:hypothetical protein
VVAVALQRSGLGYQVGVRESDLSVNADGVPDPSEEVVKDVFPAMWHARSHWVAAMLSFRAMDDDQDSDAQQRDAMLLQLLKTPPQPRPHRERAGGVSQKREGDSRQPQKAAAEPRRAASGTDFE